MTGEKDRILDIVNVKEDEDYQRIRDDLIRIGGMFSVLDELKDQDVERIISESFTPAGRFFILSQTLFPQLCEIIGRGLTLEEIGFIIGVDQAEIKTLLKRKKIRNAGNFSISDVSKTDFVKIILPLKGTFEYADGTISKDVPLKEPLLAPVHLVDDIRHNGYKTKDGHVLRQGYITKISGPLPSTYKFNRVNIISGRETKEIKNRMKNDMGMIRASSEIVIAQLELIKMVIDNERAPEYFSQMAIFFHEISLNVSHYAWRYRALNDMATYEKIERTIIPFHLVAERLPNCQWIYDRNVRQITMNIINQTILELKDEK